MKHIITYQDLQVINFILNINENINENMIERLKKMASKGVLTTAILTTLMNNPSFAQEYKKIDNSDKNKIENVIKNNTSDKILDSLSIDITNQFNSGKYILNNNDKTNVLLKLKSVESFISKNKGTAFTITIVSSESRVDMTNPTTNKPMKELELAKLRYDSTYNTIKDYLDNLPMTYKVIPDLRIGDVFYDKSELKTKSREFVVNQEKYKKDQYVRIIIKKDSFKSACSLSDSQAGIRHTLEDDYKSEYEYSITDQQGNIEFELQPGGVPDRALLFIDDILVDDTGYFSVGITSADTNSDNYNFIPKYIYELTKIRKQKTTAVKDTKFSTVDIKHFDTFKDLEKFMLKDMNYKSDNGKETGEYMIKLKEIFNQVKGDFVFYQKVITPIKLKTKLDGVNKKLKIRVYSPLGQTKFSWSGQCAN